MSFKQIRFNGSDISMMKLNGIVYYEKNSEPAYPPNTVAVYTVSGTTPVSPYRVSGKASDWTETCTDNGDGTSTMIITASSAPTALSFENRAILTVEYINTSNLTTMTRMFLGCNKLISVNGKGWDTSKVTNMYYMFYQCSELTSIDASTWNTSSVTDMRYMFYNCSKLVTLDIRNFDISDSLKYLTKNNYYDYYIHNMFYNCKSLAELRLDNCNSTTIDRIDYSWNYINSQGIVKTGKTEFPGFTDGSVHNVYYRKANFSGTFTSKAGWTVNYVD